MKEFSIDTTRCQGCRMGIGLFTKVAGTLDHFDVFAASDDKEIYPCNNADVIEPHLEQMSETDTNLAPVGELDDAFRQQELWWDNIVELAFKSFPHDLEAMENFFNNSSDKEDIDLEESLLANAAKNGVQIDTLEFPHLKTIKNKEEDNE